MFKLGKVPWKQKHDNLIVTHNDIIEVARMMKIPLVALLDLKTLNDI